MSRLWARGRWLLGPILGLGAGIGGCNEPVTDPNAPTVAASPLVSAICAGLARCCDVVREGSSDVDRCRTYYNALEAKAGSRPNAAACTAFLQARHASDELCTLGTREGGNDVCAGVLEAPAPTATRAPGQECSYADQCGAPGTAVCRVWGEAYDAPAVCAAAKVGALGQGPCLGTTSGGETSLDNLNGVPEPASHTVYRCPLDEGLYCDRQTHVCVGAFVPGEICPLGPSCDPRLGFCQISADPATGICRRWQQEGESCISETPCAPGLGCFEAVCRKGLRYAQECFRYDECASGLCEDGRCTTASTIGIGTCF